VAKIRVQLGEARFEKVTSDLVINARPDLVFDFSMLDEFINCHRAFLYRYEWNRTRLGGSAHPLIFGNGIHEAQKVHYVTLKEKNLAGKRFDKEEHSHLMKYAFLKTVHKDVLAGRFPLLPEDQPDGKRYVLNAFKILDSYLDQYPIEDFEVIDTEVPIAYIIPFEYDGDSGEIIYIGRVDLLIHYLGHYHVMEHKTSSIMGKNFMASFRPNHQVSGYIAGISEIKGLPIHWAIINAIGVYKNDTRFERERVRRETEELKSFEQQMINITREIFWYRARVKDGEPAEDVYYQNPRYCFKWNTACQFHILCTKASKPARDTLMNSAFVTRVWSPFEIHHLKAQEKEDAGTEKSVA